MSTNATPNSPEPAKDAGPSEIQADIDATRAELGQTVEQLSGHLDVKAQARKKAGEYKAHAAETVDTTKQQVLGLVAATGAKTRELTHSGEADPAADRRRGGITLGSGALLICALVAGILVRRHHANAQKTSLPSQQEIAKQLRLARQKARGTDRKSRIPGR